MPSGRRAPVWYGAAIWQEAQRESLRLNKRAAVGRANAFNCVVNRAYRGGQPQVFRREEGNGRVKYDSMRANMCATQKLFRASCWVNAAGEFSMLGA